MPTGRFWALLVVSAIVLVGARVTVAAPETCPAPTAAAARAASAAAAGDWIVNNQFPSGTYTYAVDGSGADLGGYSVVRHAGVTLALYQVAASDRRRPLPGCRRPRTRVDARPAPRGG